MPKLKDPAADPYLTKDVDRDAVGAWRERMGTNAAKDIYKGAGGHG